MTQDPTGFAYVTDHDYDENGNETKVTDPKGHIIDFTYDELNRLQSKVFHLTSEDLALYTRTHQITFHYDANDNLEQIDELKSSGTDPPVTVSSYKTYDTLDRLESETDAWGKTLAYDYDAQGNRILLVDPDGKRTVYGYDALNRLASLTLDEGTANEESVLYDYYPDGLKKKVTNPNQTVSTYLYDRSDRMIRIAHTGPLGIMSSYDYTYDENGNRSRQIETNAGRTETTDYGYDLVNRLQTVTYEVGTADATQVTYTYDLVGNRLTEQEVLLQSSTLQKDLTYSYDAINRLDSIDDPLGTEDVAYTYDENGNTLTKTKNAVTTTFLYDIRNELGEVQQGANVLGRYGYDSEGLRVLKIGDEGIRRYTYDQLSVVTEADQTNLTVSKYDYGMDQLVRLDNTSEGRSFFHRDILGSTASLTEAFGTTRQSISYDAWGNERGRVGTSANSFGFTGHELDQETGLIYAKQRFIDTEIARFLTQDRYLGDEQSPYSFHRYSYAHDNPTKYSDPFGTDVRLANETPESRRKGFYTITSNLNVNEQRNLAYKKTDDGTYDLYLRDANRIDVETASPGYKYLKQRIEERELKIDYVIIEEGQTYTSSVDNETYSHAYLSGRERSGGLGEVGGGLTVYLTPDKIEVLVPEGGTVNGVMGLTESGKDVYVEQPDYIIGAHELFGELERWASGNEDLRDDWVAAGDKAIEIENEVRAWHGLLLRSGKDHGYVHDSVTVIAEPEKKEPIKKDEKQ
jgi:RHS repeat-associated protein